jgi:hypothetical protein
MLELCKVHHSHLKLAVVVVVDFEIVVSVDLLPLGLLIENLLIHLVALVS